MGKGSEINLIYLENKLRNNGGMLGDEPLALDKVKELLKAKFETVDYESAKEDVATFIKDKESLSVWKKELFLATLDSLRAPE